MNNLIATSFTYTLRDEQRNRVVTWPGSYLGRKAANAQQLRAFVRRGLRKSGALWLRLESLTVHGLCETRWIAK